MVKKSNCSIENNQELLNTKVNKQEILVEALLSEREIMLNNISTLQNKCKLLENENEKIRKELESILNSRGYKVISKIKKLLGR